MKKLHHLVIIALLLSLMVSAFCAADDKSEITEVMNKLAADYKNKDIEGVMSAYADGPDVTGIGADALTILLKGPQQIRAAYERDFNSYAKINDCRFEIITVSSSADMACVAADHFITVTDANQTIEVSGKVTAVLKKTDGKWRIVQYHWSVPFAVGLHFKDDTFSSTGERLVRKLWADMKQQEIAVLGRLISPAFQSVNPKGVLNRLQEVTRIKNLDIDDYTLSDVKTTQQGPLIIATYFVSAEETINGERIATKPTLRLSVFMFDGIDWKWVAHANLNPKN